MYKVVRMYALVYPSLRVNGYISARGQFQWRRQLQRLIAILLAFLLGAMTHYLV
jgi:hypothetical protein